MDQKILAEIDALSKKINTIGGSLQSMVDINLMITEIADSTKLKQRHKDHMAACDKVFIMHMQQLYEEQAKLLTLLQSQQIKLQALLDDYKNNCR